MQSATGKMIGISWCIDDNLLECRSNLGLYVTVNSHVQICCQRFFKSKLTIFFMALNCGWVVC